MFDYIEYKKDTLQHIEIVTDNDDLISKFRTIIEEYLVNKKEKEEIK